MYIKRRNKGDLYDGVFYYKDPECTVLHREDGPAIEYLNGTKRWYFNGELHREDGPAIEYADGLKEWFLNGVIHREDGPAIQYVSGAKEWWFNGERHREDGPAIEYADGKKSYYLNHQPFSKEKYIQYIKKKSLCPVKKAKILKQCT